MRRTIFIRVRKGDHVFGKNLWDTADASGDNIEACTGGFEDGNTKGLSEGCVEEDGTTDEDLVRGCQRREMRMGMEGAKCGE